MEGAVARFKTIPRWYVDLGISAKFCDRTDGRIVARFRRSGADGQPFVPTVNVSNVLADSGLPTVVSDDRAVGRLAAQYFVDLGMEHFAVFAPCSTHYARLRLEGFVETLKGCRLSAARVGEPDMLDSMNPGEVSQNIARLRARLEALPRPCAIFAVDDLRAALLCRIILGAGYEIPKDFSLLGVDDNRIVCESAPVALSSVRLDSWRVGYRAAEVLAGILLGGDDALGDSAEGLRVEVPPIQVVERASTRVPPMDDPLVARALKVIEEEFGQSLRVDALAARLGVTTRYLQMRFKAARDCTPQQALLRRRLREAKSLLVDSTRSVTEIAYACGFGDYKQMAVHLRRDCGQTATAFRKARRGFPDRSGSASPKGRAEPVSS